MAVVKFDIFALLRKHMRNKCKRPPGKFCQGHGIQFLFSMIKRLETQQKTFIVFAHFYCFSRFCPTIVVSASQKSEVYNLQCSNAQLTEVRVIKPIKFPLVIKSCPQEALWVESFQICRLRDITRPVRVLSFREQRTVIVHFIEIIIFIYFL